MAYCGAQPPRVWYRLILVAAVCAAALTGFFYGRADEQRRAAAWNAAVPGLSDYEALATYNGYSIVRAQGPSMQPALAQYNFLLVRDTRHIQRGDILISGHHGIHRVVALPGETAWLAGGVAHVCSLQPGGRQYCRALAEPWVRYRQTTCRQLGPLAAGTGYIAASDNRYCPEWLVSVPANDVIGVYAGSLLSYGPLGPRGTTVRRPTGPTLVYDPPPTLHH